MEIKFTFLSLDKPYESEKTGAVYCSFNGLLDVGLGAKLCNVAADKKAYDQLKEVAPTTVVVGTFDVEPSYGRKRPELTLVAVGKSK